MSIYHRRGAAVEINAQRIGFPRDGKRAWITQARHGFDGAPELPGHGDPPLDENQGAGAARALFVNKPPREGATGCGRVFDRSASLAEQLAKFLDR